MHNRVKRRGLALVVTAGLLAVPIAPPAAASAHRPDQASSHGHALADRNRDHLSDGLDARLAHTNPTKRIGVVATFADRGAMRSAHRDLGGVGTTFSLTRLRRSPRAGPGRVVGAPAGRPARGGELRDPRAR
jgi:hypothetical protein